MGPSYIHSPLIQSLPLSNLLNKRVFLKLDLLQPSGSFKDRGIGNLCNHLAKENSKGFISSSGGNAGMAVSYAAQRLNLPATVIVPTCTSELVVQKLKDSGAQIVLHGDNWNDADDLAHQKAQELKLDYIPPFDHPLVWQGHETLVHELKQDNFKPGAILLAVGGGGLYLGVMQGLYALGWKDVSVVTCETEGADSMAQAVNQGKHVSLDKIDTIAKSLGAKQIAEHAFEWTQKHPPVPLVVSDKHAVDACLKFAKDHRLMVEPACGAALSAAYENHPALKDIDDICIIVCGGNDVSIDLLRHWQQQFGL